jgi:hypothetical protein
MNHDRIHAALDGEIPRASLTEDERSELYRLEAAVHEAADALAAATAPDLTGRVMAALPAGAPAPRLAGRVLGGARLAAAALWRPRPVAVRPAWGLALAAALVAALAGPPVLPRPAETAGTVAGAAVAPAPPLYVQFRLEAPGASHVALTGSFTGWRPAHELHESSPGSWSVLVPLEPGIHDYVFVIDGERWLPDPAAYAVDDGFGGTNSRLFLSLPHAAS